MTKIRSSEISPERTYVLRRKFMMGMGALVTNALLLGGCGRQAGSPTVASTPAETKKPAPPTPAPGTTETPVSPTPTSIPRDLTDALTEYDAITSYVNFYEFTLSKSNVAAAARNFRPSPWAVQVGGLVENPKTFDIDDLLELGQEERVYRMRCVEAWSMVIPWQGFPLARLLEAVSPTSRAKYVRFETLYDPEQMPGQKDDAFPWPYVEGLSLDEAMHDLTILATGIYGKPLLAQNGAPVRLVVPWKYGFKSIKSIVKIDLVEDMPVSLWMTAGPVEYGFWANVNPKVPHRRWSQATERRIGESGRRETLLFNGYADEVAHLYPDLDNRDWFY